MKSLITVILGLCLALSQSQAAVPPGKLTGTVQDSIASEKLSYAHLILMKEDKVVGKAIADEEGNFSFGGLTPGKYTLCAMFLGYDNDTIKGILVHSNKTTQVQVWMSESSLQMSAVTVIKYRPPIYDRDNTTTVETYTRQEIRKLPTRSVSGVKASRGGLHVNGGRNTSNVYYVDGIKLRPAPNLPNQTSSPNNTYNQPAYQSPVSTEKEFNTEEYAATEENIWQSPRNEPLSTFSIDVDKASYANIRRYLNDGQLPPAGAVRIEEMVNYFHYTYAQPEDGKPFALYTEQASCPWNNTHQLVMIGLQAKKIDEGQLTPSNLVFLIDVSGSMDEPNKLPLVKESLKMLVDKMREEDKVSILVYAGNAGLVLPSTPGSNKRAIKEATDMLEAGGSTAGGEGILLAYDIAKQNFIKGGNNRVILATDGDFNVGVSSDSELEKLIESKRKDGIYLTVLGFGMGNYKDSKMEVLADKGNGNYAYVDNEEEARKVLVTEFAGTMYTIAKDVKLQIEWNPAKVSAYRLIGYEDRKLNAEDFNNDMKDAGEMGSGHTVTALYEVIPATVHDSISPVDSLKYQKMGQLSNQYNNEILTLKVRYKKPEAESSQLVIQPVLYKESQFDSTSENFRWAATVAAFGQILRHSQYKGDISYDQLIAYAKAASSNDPENYKSDFIKLLKKAEDIQSKLTDK